MAQFCFKCYLLALLTDANLLKGRSVTSDYQQITGINYNSKD